MNEGRTHPGLALRLGRRTPVVNAGARGCRWLALRALTRAALPGRLADVITQTTPPKSVWPWRMPLSDLRREN